MSQLHKIPLSHLQIGMYVSDETPGLKDSGLNSRGLISRSETVAKLRAAGITEIYIDVGKGKASCFALPVNRASLDPPKVPLEQERNRAEAVYGEAVNLVNNIMRDVKMGNAIDVGPVEDLADDINNSVLNNANALLCLSQIREKDQYLLEHSINVGILMGVFTRHLGFDRDAVHQLVTGALLHDIGKIRVPHHVLNKPGKLTDDEWQEMRNHVTYGQEVLLKSEGISDVAMFICAQHHERLDGTGYPRNIAGDAITSYGRLASIVDIYDALTADRVYHEGKSPFAAMKILVELSDKHLDKALVYEFIRCMSVYPVGTVVELSNGRLAVVIQSNKRDPSKPLVRSFFHLTGRHFEATKVIDLAHPHAMVKVVATHDHRALNIDINKFI